MAATDLLGIEDLSVPGIGAVLDLAASMKRDDDRTPHLRGRCLGLLFTVPSTRTRVSFQVAAGHLGAQCYSFGADELRLANRESVEDTAAVMGRYLDALVVRWYDMDDWGAGHRRLRTMAAHSDAPVVNALDDTEHPCQTLADLLTLRELFGGDLTAPRIAFTWAYSSRQKTPGVLHSSLLAAAMLGMRATVVHPPRFGPVERTARRVAELAASSGADIGYSTDLLEGVRGADVVYVLGWKSPELTGQAEWDARSALADRWRVTEEVMAAAGPSSVLLDCMPTTRGEEIDADVKEGPRSRILTQAENRLHTQKAVLLSMLGDATGPTGRRAEP